MTTLALVAALSVCDAEIARAQTAGHAWDIAGMSLAVTGLAGGAASMYGARQLLRRRVETERYWITAVLSAALFAVGLLAGGVANDVRDAARYEALLCTTR